MKKQIIHTLEVQRHGRTNHCLDILNCSDIIEFIEFQILKWGNALDRDGCVYGIECEDEATRIKAEYVLNRYASKELIGWYDGYDKHSLIETDKDAVYRQMYIKKNKIKITVRELNDYYVQRKRG